MNSRQKYLKGLMFLLILACSHVTFSQDSPRLVSLSAHASLKSFNGGFAPAFGYGGGVSFSIKPAIDVKLSIETTHSRKEYDVIGSTNSFAIDLTTYQLQLKYLVLNIGNSIGLSATGGVGIAKSTSSATSISLGALGQMVIPEQSESRMAYSIGASVAKSIATHVALQVEPQVFFLSPLSSLKPNYSLSGGITVGLF